MANSYWLLEQLVTESSMRGSYERIVESFSSYSLLVCPSFSLPNFYCTGCVQGLEWAKAYSGLRSTVVKATALTQTNLTMFLIVQASQK